MENRAKMYRFPWSVTDNPGGWIEVTDKCDIHCVGCYRHNLTDHRPLESLKEEVRKLKELINCDFITIAGGEPLLYPYLYELIKYISSLNLKSVVFSNGEKFSLDVGKKLRKAGLTKIHFHVDSGQARPKWENKTETELNVLRQKLADTVHQIKGLQCGFHVTVYRKALKEIPQIVQWCLQNRQKVQHISLIAFRSIPVDKNIRYMVNGEEINVSKFNNSSADQDINSITSEEIFSIIKKEFPYLYPCAYLNGSTEYSINKFLVSVNIGTKNRFYGVLGKKTTEFAQVFYHVFFGKYFAFLNKAKIGFKVFFASFFDKHIRKAFLRYCRLNLIRPWKIFDRIYLQSIHIQQPGEILNGKINLCDDCVNMTLYEGKLIKPCQMDEYRMFGGPIVPIANN